MQVLFRPLFCILSPLLLRCVDAPSPLPAEESNCIAFIPSTPLLIPPRVSFGDFYSDLFLIFEQLFVLRRELPPFCLPFFCSPPLRFLTDVPCPSASPTVAFSSRSLRRSSEPFSFPLSKTSALFPLPFVARSHCLPSSV